MLLSLVYIACPSLCFFKVSLSDVTAERETFFDDEVHYETLLSLKIGGGACRYSYGTQYFKLLV